jgi:hypothetical protein
MGYGLYLTTDRSPERALRARVRPALPISVGSSPDAVGSPRFLGEFW